MLSEKELGKACKILAKNDKDLAKILKKYGTPPIWSRKPGFSTLIHIILEQQVSIASAKAAYLKLLARLSPLTPKAFLKLSDEELREDGFSRQKTRYCRILAESLLSGELDLESLEFMSDEDARNELIKLTGIGNWTADVYLLMVLLRPDIWPVGDIALQRAAGDIKGLESSPKAEELEKIGEAWRPWRSAAARLLWFNYLDGESAA